MASIKLEQSLKRQYIETSACIDHGFTKSVAPMGYALVAHPYKKSRCITLHRLIYADKLGLTLKDIEGVVVRHTCDNPRCINPEHLIGGTLADNNRDRAERGRSAKTVPSRQKLSSKDCSEILLRHKNRDKQNGTRALAREFNVDPAVICKVLRGVYICG